MIKNKLLLKVFSSGMQAVAVQLIGGVFFYFISIYLPKDSFGIINWMNAICLFITTILGCGLEQVAVRRIAASKTSDWAATAFFSHAIIGFVITFLLLIVISTVFGNTTGIYKFLPWYFAAQGLIYIGVPLKQFLNAKEIFTPYAIIAIISNICKTIAAFILLQIRNLNINSVIIILICSAAFELCGLLIYIIINTKFSFKFRFNAYAKLLKESSAQYIAVIFDMSLSRIDWILLGFMSTRLILADYSFAYRAFELARLPMFIIAPIILPRISRLMANGNLNAENQLLIRSFNTVELYFAMMIPLALNILWTPLVVLITNGKYGAGNELQFLILSICIPFQLYINLLWSLSFGGKKYRQVSTITIVCAVVNVILNLLLIPKLGGAGAAIAFLVTTLIQSLLYYKLVNRQILSISLQPFIGFLISAVLIYLLVANIHLHFLIQLPAALLLYMLVGLVSGQMKREHLNNFKHFLSR